MTALIILAVALPLLPLLITLLNLATWRTPRGTHTGIKVSALVPARNEVATIVPCVQALLDEPVYEVVVLDDGSTDGTSEILARLSADEPRLRVLSGAPLPAGWVGKAFACHQLAKTAHGDALWFVDADTLVKPGALAALASVDADVVTAFPHQAIGSLGEGLVVPLLHLTYLSWLPLALVRRVSDPRVTAANGQLLFVHRKAYNHVGGFASVRDAIVDDVAFCRRAKLKGLGVAFVPGDTLATCRMYDNFSTAWRGFSKNLYPGVGSAPLAVVIAAGYFGAFVLPWLLWPVAPVAGGLGIAANLLQRSLVAWRFSLPAWTVPLHLPAVLCFFGIGLTSAWWTATGSLQWRGRTYASEGGLR